MASPALQAVTTILGVQALVTLVAMAGATWLGGSAAAGSAGVGGGISIIATGFFALRVFVGGSQRELKQIVRAFYVGEALKLMVTAVLFVLVITTLDVLFLPLILTYAAALLANWLVLPFTLTDPR